MIKLIKKKCQNKKIFVQNNAQIHSIKDDLISVILIKLKDQKVMIKSIIFLLVILFFLERNNFKIFLKISYNIKNKIPFKMNVLILNDRIVHKI